MEDIAPELLEKLRKRFADNLAGNKDAAALLAALKQGGVDYTHAERYAYEVGAALADAFGAELSSAVLPDGRLYWNIAQSVVSPLLHEDHDLVSAYAATVQAALNEAAGLGLKAQVAPFDADRADGLLNMLANAEQYDDVAWVLNEPVKNFLQAVVDETLRRNVEFQGKAGLSPKIIRKAESKCCKWCAALAGTYTYPDVPRDVYRRHERCRCTVEYDPGSGKRQNVHTREWTEPEETAKIEARKIIGLRVSGASIQKVSNHALQRMAERSVPPESIIDAIERPLQIKPVKNDELGRPSFIVVGRKATLTINPNTGVLSTVYPTHTATVKKLLGRKGDKT